MKYGRDCVVGRVIRGRPLRSTDDVSSVIKACRLLALYAGLSTVAYVGLGGALAILGADHPILWALALATSALAGWAGTAGFGPPVHLGTVARVRSSGMKMITIGSLALSAALLVGVGLRGYVGAWSAVSIVLWAVVEEMVFRGFPAPIERYLVGARVSVTALYAAATAITFAIMHEIGHPLLVADKVVFGVCAYVLCVITGSIILPAALHASLNVVALAMVPAGATSASTVVFALTSMALTLGCVSLVARSAGRCRNNLACPVD